MTQISVDVPSIPEMVETDDGVMITEDEKQRFMPLQRSLYAGVSLSLEHSLAEHTFRFPSLRVAEVFRVELQTVAP